MKLSDNPLALSSFFLPDPSYETLKKCKDCGISSLELSIGGVLPAAENSVIQQYWLRLIDASQRAGVNLWSAHLSFWEPYDIANLDKSVRDAALERQFDMMRFVHENTDIKIFVVHPSSEPILPENRFMQTQYSKNSLRALADEAEKYGSVIAIEDLPRTCLGNTTESMQQLISADKRLRICLDTNHLLRDTNEDFIRAFCDKIITLHVSDYDRIDERHLMPYEGINNWKSIFTLLLRCGYKGPVLFEIMDDKGYTYEQIRECYDRLCGECENI